MRTKWFSKKMISVILSLVLAFSLIPASETKADNSSNTITVYVTVSNQGTLATAADGSYVANVPVTVTCEGNATLDDALKALHEAYYVDGVDGYATYGSWVISFWGDSSGAFGFYKNNAMTNTVDAETVEDGDYIVAYIYADQTYWSDQYSYFDVNSTSIAADESVTLTLNGYSYDEAWNLVPASVAGAELEIYKVGSNEGFVATGVLTDESGQATYEFTKAGTYIVTASSDSAVITAPVCIVNVVCTEHVYRKVIVLPSCEEGGYTEYICVECDDRYVTDATEKTEHTYETSLTKATTSKDGSIVTECSFCGDVQSTTTIAKISSAALSKTSYTYTGSALKPTVTVKDSNGKKIAASNYTVTYKNNKAVGKATVTIQFKGNYSGTITKTFTINPKATSIKSLTAKSKGFKISWKKVSSQITGYEIQYSTSSKFTKKTTVTKTAKSSKTSLAVSKLKAKKKYYVRIRTYKTVSGKKYYSAWSKAKTVTTKK